MATGTAITAAQKAALRIDGSGFSGFSAFVAGEVSTSDMSKIYHGAGQRPHDALHVLDFAHNEAAQIIHGVRLGQNHDVVRPGDGVHPYDTWDFADRGGHVMRLSDLCLDQDVCLDHDPTPIHVRGNSKRETTVRIRPTAGRE